MDEYKYRHVSLVNHPKNEEGVFLDLVKKYKKYGTLYIGVDFDNTLLPYDPNGNGELFDEDGLTCVPSGFIDIVWLLKECKELGLKLCLWSLPMSRMNLNWKVEWCRKHGIGMDYVNESPLLNEFSKEFGKVHFNLLLDDVAGLESGYSILKNVIEWIKQYNKNHEV